MKNHIQFYEIIDRKYWFLYKCFLKIGFPFLRFINNVTLKKFENDFIRICENIGNYLVKNIVRN